MCDDWTDLIAYVIQKYLRQVQACDHFEMDWLDKSSNRRPDQEDSFCVKSGNFVQTEERFTTVQNELTICEKGDPFIQVTRTEIDPLISQLLNSGLLYFLSRSQH